MQVKQQRLADGLARKAVWWTHQVHMCDSPWHVHGIVIAREL